MEMARLQIMGWTATGAALGVVVFSAPSAIAQLARVATVEVAQAPEYTRLSFSFNGERAAVTPTSRGDRLELVFSRSGDIDIAELRSTPPRFIRSVERVARADGRVALALQLDAGVRFRQFIEARAIVIDLLPPDSRPPPPATLTGPIQITESRDATEFRMTWSRPVRAAIVQRGETAWAVFDQAASVDLRNARRAGRHHSAVTAPSAEGATAIRIALAADMRVTARAEGAAWIVRVAEARQEAAFAPVRRELGPDGRGRIAVAFGRDGVVRAVRDPVLQDVFQVALLDGPVIGVQSQRAAPEAILLPAAHGALIAPRAPEVTVRFDAGQLLVSGGQRQTIPITVDYVPKEPSLGAQSRLDLREHQDVPLDLVLDRKADLERRAAEEGMQRGAATRARLDLVRFLIAHELAAEALGALDVAAINQPQLSFDPGYRLMRAIASMMMGRKKDAEIDLAVSGLAGDPVAALWRGVAAFENGSFEAAQRNLERGRDALDILPQAWRTRFLITLSESALQNRDLAAARAASIAAEAQAKAGEDSDHARLLSAIVANESGESGQALEVFTALMESRSEAIAARASLEAIRTRRVLGQLSEDDAAAALDPLRFRWRGDAFELAVNQTLGALYVQMGRWRDGLDVMRAVAVRFPNHPIGRQLRQDMSALFESLFLDGEADKLEPVQALGLFYDFQDLTPIGANGDRMVRALAGRLAALDLLQQAGDLLKYQIDQRLDGLAKAQIAADLAVIYLQDARPEQALNILASTRQPRMPAALVAERRILEARAQVELGRADIAAELLQRDRGADAQRLRGEIAWRAKDWPKAVQELRTLTTMLPKEGALDDADRAVVMRAAIAAAMAEDRDARTALRRDFAARLRETSDSDGFEIVTGDLDIDGAAIRDLAGRIAQRDMLDRFMRNLQTRLAAPVTALQ
jgi:hypothetical protein